MKRTLERISTKLAMTALPVQIGQMWKSRRGDDPEPRRVMRMQIVGTGATRGWFVVFSGGIRRVPIERVVTDWRRVR